MADPRRELTFLLAGPERRLLRWIAARLPGWVTSDQLTVLGVLAATATAAGYALSGLHPGWLWGASAALVVNWLGDSLDGTLARVRHTERPRYGYYLDHAVDAYATAAIGIGLGLSPYVSLGVALGLVVVYLWLSINVYLESTVFGAFRLAYGRLGPTEVRLILIAVNTGLALHHRIPWLAGVPIRLLADGLCIVLALAMFALLVNRFTRNLRDLARLEPVPH
ncbi:MAG TPA: CDP-alcohol phosphatidyltransferase family protein [Gemmatimonadales bacterium]